MSKARNRICWSSYGEVVSYRMQAALPASSRPQLSENKNENCRDKTRSRRSPSRH
ncbi:DUF2931 family protein [Rhizobium herbae]|uniref:DUF2931 family protein n=1 Tax=Rhizobium herbae TaxID=508661 RepID=UPI001C6F3967